MMLYEKVWSPYVAGVAIGLLQIPAFLLIETAGRLVVLRYGRSCVGGSFRSCAAEY